MSKVNAVTQHNEKLIKESQKARALWLPPASCVTGRGRASSPRGEFKFSCRM